MQGSGYMSKPDEQQLRQAHQTLQKNHPDLSWNDFEKAFDSGGGQRDTINGSSRRS